MPQTIQCPNCKAPVEPDPQKPTVVCAYCGYHMKNTVYVSPQPYPPVEGVGYPHPRRTWTRWWLLYVVVFGLIGLASVAGRLVCSRPGPTIATTGPTTTGPAGVPDDREKLDPGRRLELKLAPYIECLTNTYRFILENGRDRYLGWVKDPEAGPTCKEEWVKHGVIAPADSWIEGCGKQAEQAAALPPDLPDLERAGTAYAAAVTKLGPLLKEAAPYYEKRSYALDDCAKGRALHPRLMAGFKSLVAAREALKPLLAARVKGTLQRCLDRSKETDRSSYLWARAIKLAGDALVEMRTQWKAKQPDLERVKQAIARYSEALTDLEALGDKQKGEAGFSYHWHKRPLDELQTAAVAFLKSKAGHNLSSHKRYLIRVSGWKLSSIEGTFEKVASHYDAIVKGTESWKHCGRLPPCDFAECPEPR